MKLTRRVTFSSGHRYWDASLDRAGNEAKFGRWASPFNHGHNYVLDVTCAGEVDLVTGMVVNIKDIDDLIQAEVVGRFDQRSINDEIPPFDQIAPCVENLLRFIPGLLASLPARLTSLRLEETPTFWGELDVLTEKMTVTRVFEFCAAHRLNVPSLSEAQNQEMFGKCNNAAGHGHNYTLEVSVSGTPDPATGFICDLRALDAVVDQEVVERYDHKNFNCDLPEFASKVPTSEVIVQAIWDRLEGSVPARLERVRLFETARSMFEVARATEG